MMRDLKKKMLKLEVSNLHINTTTAISLPYMVWGGLIRLNLPDIDL